jgi:DNA/RNA-binding domain of Phe-tRNA-synthetase-like protein
LIDVTESWLAAFPGALAGALVMRGVENPQRCEALEARKRELEEALRAVEPDAARLAAYADYYRTHGKTYHVRGQWESVARKGRPIPTRAALVEAMFMAELRNLVLTAGHDVAALELPLRADATADGDTYVQLSGAERTLRAGDMMMADKAGIVSTVLHGPDRRTRITPATTEVLFAVYVPAGIGSEAVRVHLEDIRANVLLIAPDAETVAVEITGAG